MKQLKTLSFLLAAVTAAGIAAAYPAVQVSADIAELTQSAELLDTLYPFNTYLMRDNNENTYFCFAAGHTVTIACDQPIAGISMKFQKPSGGWTVTADDCTLEFGQQGYQHDFADVSELGANRVTVTFSAPTDVAELRVFGEGELPDDVQVWQPCHEKADIALFSTHNDDEHLFFLGLIPDALARGKKIEVIYFANHYGEPIRMHELLNALWKVGLRNYPVMGPFPDQYSETLPAAKQNLAYAGFSYDSVIGYQVAMLRRFRPEIAVGHDINGEYGHGQHRANSDSLMNAVNLSGNPAYYPDSAAQYGAWDVPKTYIHLWGQNRLVMNYDIPLDYYGGKTAYQVSMEGYACHNSQQYTWFTQWARGYAGAPITAASQIGVYSPCIYGLYRSTVGLDTGINDMFEHIDTPRLGDADESGTVTAADAQMTLTEAAAIVSGSDPAFTDAQKKAADVDLSGAVTAADAQHILVYSVLNAVGGQSVPWENVLAGNYE